VKGIQVKLLHVDRGGVIELEELLVIVMVGILVFMLLFKVVAI
jgi:hypothetical protein